MIVTYYYPWGYFYPVHYGCDTVAGQHLDYFRNRGFRPRIVLTRAQPERREAFEREYHWVDDVIVADARSQPQIQGRLTDWSFGNQLAAHAMLAECTDLRQALSRAADLVFINYVFAAPLLDAVPRGAFRVLETHDILSSQFASQRESTVQYQRHLATEFSVYDLFDLVLMINQQEESRALARCYTDVTYVARPVDIAPETAHSAEEAEEFDLLFVGSNHVPNVEGASWFYHNIFEPMLKPEGLRWAIAGTVSDDLPFRDANVTFLGRVPDLNALYRRSRVVVVPLFRGTGISIKTLEALGQRKPVVTTPCGRRGLGPEADGALICRPFEEEPQQAAEAILALCSSTPLRRQYAEAAAAYISRHFSTEAYYGRMDELLGVRAERRRQRQRPAASIAESEQGRLLVAA